MTYTQLTINELIWIDLYHEKRTTPTEISRKSSRSRQTVYKVINWLKKGSCIQDYYKNYKKNKKRCGAKAKVLRKGEKEYVLEKIAQGWTPDVIESRREVENRGKQAFRRSLKDREQAYPEFSCEFGHLEGDTIVGKDHKSTVIKLVERLSKAIITIKPEGRTAKTIEVRLKKWLETCSSQ